MSKNHLSQETSLYLRQHSQQPVNWYPWGSKAFLESKKSNKPIFLSIGYASCHCCHVMAHESFEDDETAKILNRDFVSIKVDREEFPDIDHIYMEAVQVMTNHAGWPLSVFLTPELKPFFGGTYFPKEAKNGQVSFCDVLKAVVMYYNDKKEDIIAQTREITHILSSRDSNKIVPEDIKNTIKKDNFESYKVLLKAVNAQRGKCLELLEKEFDNDYSGFGMAPKFLQPPKLYLFLMSHDKRLNELSFKTLKAVQSGGITDHIEGGLSRYSVDRQWCVPHFEKMLYDNALALELYSLQAFDSIFNENSYKDLMTMSYGISKFLESDLKDKDTELYYSALDADSEGIEGFYYTYSYDDILEVLKVGSF